MPATRERFPVPTKDQEEYIRNHPLVLKTGQLLQLGGGMINVCTCMQHSHDKRKINSICAERALRFYCTDESIRAFEEKLTEVDDVGEVTLNYKAFNILRAPLFTAQGTSVPGGKSSPSDFQAYRTIARVFDKMERTTGRRGKYFATVMCIHDGCAAAMEDVETIISWELAMRLTYHDLWRSNVGDEVDFFIADINTQDSSVKSFELLPSRFNRAEYIDAMNRSLTITTHVPGNKDEFDSCSFAPLQADQWTGNIYQQAACGFNV